MGGRRLVWQRLAGVEYALSVMSCFKSQESKVLVEGEIMVLLKARSGWGRGILDLMYNGIHVGIGKNEFSSGRGSCLGREREVERRTSSKELCC